MSEEQQQPQGDPAEIKRVQNAIDFIKAAGFTYPDEMIKNFYICLKTKPFIILAGISGTGKTQITRLMAKAFAAKYFIVPVSSSWKTDADLLGYWDPTTKKYVDTKFTQVIRFAIDCYRKNKPDLIFVCLDEMNLARVEHYFAKFLSAMEGDTPEERTLVLDGPGETLFWPPNLFFIGTVNMDETTFNFSDKVLDRANSIEFTVNVDDLFMDTVKSQPPDPIPFPYQDFAKVRRDLTDPSIQDVARRWRGEIVHLWKMLEPHHYQFGFRVRDQIELYILNSHGLLDERVAFDIQVKQKILPKIQGYGESLKMLLMQLQDYFIDHRYRWAAKKVEEMKARLIREDATGYYPGQIVRKRHMI